MFIEKTASLLLFLNTSGVGGNFPPSPVSRCATILERKQSWWLRLQLFLIGVFMKKNVLSLSIAAMIGGLGFAGAASAGISADMTNAVAGTYGATSATSLTVTPDGVGHILLVPYFSAQNGNGTLLSIVNTDAKNGKAVKVRFRGAANSDDVFDFQVFLSPGDVWTANVSQDTATGLAQIYTPDNSCTLPRAAVLNATKFKTDRVYGADDAAKAGETREGYVEIFNMADIPAQLPGTVAAGVTGLDADKGTLVANPLYTAIKHTSAGTNPCGLAATDSALPAAIQKLAADPASTAFADVMKHGFTAPSTGLMGSWTVLNVLGASVAWSGNATALQANGFGRVVFSPQKDTSVAAAAVNTLTADPLLRNDGAAETSLITPAMYDLPDLSTPYAVAGAVTGATPLAEAEKLMAALAVKNVMNEYVTNPAIHAQTDWVFSMPTRRYAVGVNYAPAATPTKPALVFNTTVTTQTSAAGADTSKYFTPVNTKIGAGGSSGNPIYQACVEPGGAVTAYDQEEATASGEFVVSPGTAKKVLFCGEVSVLTFNGTSALSAKIAPKDIDAGFVNGWMNINTAGLLNGAGPATMGLPILGSSFVQMTGPVVAGKSTNFSITQPHRFTR